jgi:hypothetical protein
MRVAAMVTLALTLCGCADKPTTGGTDQADQPRPRAEQPTPVEPASLAGEYVGTYVKADVQPKSPMPASMRELLGDAALTLIAEGRRFDMIHQGLTVLGSYKVDGDQLILQVETVEGLSQDDLARVNFAANKKARKEPSDPEMLKLFQEILFLTDWRFQLTKDGFDQLGTGDSPPRYQFKRKLD